MRDLPRRPESGDEIKTEPSQDRRTDDASQRGRDEARSDSKQPYAASGRPPDAARPVDPNDLQSLRDYRDERARQEQAKRIQYDRTTSVPEPDSPPPTTPSSPPPLHPKPREATRREMTPRQPGEPANVGDPSQDRLHRPGAGRPVDPNDLQSLLDYRDERARALSRVERAKQREYEDRRRTSVPEANDPSPPEPQASSASSDSAGRSDAPSDQKGPSAAGHRPAVAPQPDRASDDNDFSSMPDGSDAVGDVEDAEAELQALVKAGLRADASSNDGSVRQPSNRDRPPQEGDINYNVDVPHDWSQSITDIDLIKGGTLWEVKKVTGKDPRMDVDTWTNAHVQYKLDKYVEARQYLAGYENAPLGLLFVQPNTTRELRQTVESAVADWLDDNPGETVKIRWAK